MKIKLRFCTYPAVIKYALYFFGFILLHGADKTSCIYPTALFAVLLTFEKKVFFLPFIFVASYAVMGKTGALIPSGIAAVFLPSVISLYKKYGTRPKLEIAIFTAISSVGFLFIENTEIILPSVNSLISAALTSCLSLIFFIAFNYAIKKGLNYKPSTEEKVSFAVCVFVFGLCVCNLLSPSAWQAVSAAVVLTVAFTYKKHCIVFACVCGLSLAVHFGNINYASVFLFWGIFAYAGVGFSRYLAAPLLLLSDAIAQFLFSVYGNSYIYSGFIFTLLGAAAFCIFPTKILLRLKEKLTAFQDKQLVRKVINQSRLIVSDKLYDMSEVFAEIANSFGIFKETELDEDAFKEKIAREFFSSVCGGCKRRALCERESFPERESLFKAIDIGFAKGKLSFIDIPTDFADGCAKINETVYFFNRFFAEYRSLMIDKSNLNNGRDLLAKEAQGVSDLLKGLAFECGKTLKYKTEKEKELSIALRKNGFNISEILIYGENESAVVSVIVCMKEVSDALLRKTVSKTLGYDFSIFETAEITENKYYFALKKSADYDAVFGVAGAVKDGSDKCGDTHSCIRISDDKFLLALSDGMGSGKNAEKISSASLSLIESFYKAGLSGDLILSTVNKLLAINTEDFFTALDVSVVNLRSLSVDFIKYGAPFGIICGKDGMKIVQGNSLPLGILDQLKPSVCSASLSDGDTVALFTDGITDAFGSSSDLIDYIRSLPAKNPQTLADSVLKKAIEINDGQKKDDMTVLAVRIFKRKNA